MTRSSLQIVLIIMLLAVFGVSYWLFEKKPDARHSAPSKSNTKKESSVVKSEMDWAKSPQDQFLEFRVLFQNTNPNEMSNEKHFGSMEVLSGESVVTDGYEIESGVFAFAKLTPQIKVDQNGSEIIEVRNAIFVVSISGEYESVIDAPMNFTSGQLLSWGGGGSLGTHMAHVKATLNTESRKVRLETAEVFYPLKIDVKKAD